MTSQRHDIQRSMQKTARDYYAIFETSLQARPYIIPLSLKQTLLLAVEVWINTCIVH